MQPVTQESICPVIAFVKGEAIHALPQDLYIPPDALKIFLEAFEGPFDLLLYLIKKQNIDILDLPVADITRQYVNYVEVMQELNLELAAEYLVMAAFLAEIKSRLLLPKPAKLNDEEELDPRAELIKRLQEYERFKKAAEDIDQLPRVERDIFLAKASALEIKTVKAQPTVELTELLLAFLQVIERAKLSSHHQIQIEPLSVRERMSEILQKIQSNKEFVQFSDCFKVEEGRLGVVVTFIAILELIRQSLVEIIQAQAFAPIHLKAVALVT